jgi:hypothetical protein
MSCHDQTAPDPVSVLYVEPTSLEVMVNEGVQLSAVPQNVAGVALAGRLVTWTSQEPLVATVTQSGRVTGVSIGQTTVVVESEGVTAEVPVSVIAAAGELDVWVTKAGLAPDPQGLRLLIDDQPLGGAPATVGHQSVALPVGMHTVRIEGIESRCELVGESSRVVFLVARQRMTISFSVACRLPGQLVVKTLTTGQRTVNDPYHVTLDGGPGVPIATDGELRFDLPPRNYLVSLSTLDARCLVSSAHQEAGVFESIISTVQFQVRCYEHPPSLSGEKLVVSYNSQFGSGIDAMDPDGAVRFSLDDSAGDAALSTDGRRLAFRSFVAGGSRLIVLDLGTGTRSVSAGVMHISALSWSPDGQRLVTGLTSNDATSLVVLRADGSVERNLGQTERAPVSAHWAPDGSKIAFTRNNHDVMLVNADGSNVRALTSSTDRYFDGGDWSADGRTLLVRSYKQYCYYYSWYCYQYDARVVVLEVATGKELRSVSVPEYAFGFVWGRTTSEVYFIQAGDVFHTSLDVYAPVNLSHSPQDEWSVLWGNFAGSAAPAVRFRVKH